MPIPIDKWAKAQTKQEVELAELVRLQNALTHLQRISQKLRRQAFFSGALAGFIVGAIATAIWYAVTL